MRLQKITMALCALTLFFGVNMNSCAEMYGYVLGKFELDDLLLSDIRWSDGRWHACFMVHPGIFVVANEGQDIGKGGLIKEIGKFHVLVKNVIELENGEWAEEERMIYLSEGPFSYKGEYGCNWNNSILNYEF